MKKMLYSAVITLALTGSAFANENAGINPKNVKTSNQVVSIRLSSETSKKPSSLAVEMQYYDIECSSGAKAHKAFASLQAAWDWGIKFCSPTNQ
jgi:hypothetical protein